jgi:cytochrome c peroxidase
VTVTGRFENQQQGSEQAAVVHGQKLFSHGTFDGNGRTCLSCHSRLTGTISPLDVQQRFARTHTQDDPLFRSLDSDDGLGGQYNRLLEHATIRVLLDLPANVSLESDPSADSVVVHRGIPSVIDSGLATALMHDGRAPDLETQALGAIMGHAEAMRLPTAEELRQIAEYERSLFSRPELARFFQGGPPPMLPQGTTAEEIRGRRHFAPGGLCALCHAGPMLNETSTSHPFGGGQRFENIFVSERNRIGNPMHTFLFRNADGTTNRVETPDPGLGLVKGDARHVNFFRIPTLWNVRNTAPYFHDNSAKTIEEVLEHYQLYLPLSDQDAKDIIAFLKLL